MQRLELPIHIFKINKNAKDLKADEIGLITLYPIYFKNIDGFTYENHMLKPNEEMIAHFGWAINILQEGFEFEIPYINLNHSFNYPLKIKIEMIPIDKNELEDIKEDFLVLTARIKNTGSEKIELRSGKPLCALELISRPIPNLTELSLKDIKLEKIINFLY